jgi:GT2 family glycosyltransferase
MQPVDMSVVIISANSARYLGPCLDSLHRSPTKANVEVLVVDNHSSDNTIALLSQFPGVVLLARHKRRTFAENNNFAIARSAGRYILLLNADTEVRPGSLDVLIGFLDDHPDCGACGPRMEYPDGSLQLSCRRFPTFGAVLARGTPLRHIQPFKSWHRSYTMADWDHRSTREVDWLIGACLAVRRNAIVDVGVLDEGYRMYYEDVDWCSRMKGGGWRVYYVPDATVMHHYQRASASSINRDTLGHARSVARFLARRLQRRLALLT